MIKNQLRDRAGQVPTGFISDQKGELDYHPAYKGVTRDQKEYFSTINNS